MIEVKLDGVGRDFGERRVLNDLSRSFRPGDRVVVRGPNGTGKSTLLKILAGLLEPTRGKVVLTEDGEDRDDGFRRSVTGYLAPDLALYDEFSALENLDFFGRTRGIGRDEARDLALLERVGLKGREHDPLKALSTGLRQRSKLAYTLQANPRILLLDEPSSNLDEKGRKLMESIVMEAADRDTIVIVASNDPAEFAWGKEILDLA
jgi:heme exporter protein A